MPYSLVTAPATYPVTLTEVKDQLRELSSDNDTHITSILQSATEEIEICLWRKIVTQTWRYYTNYLHDVEIPFGNLQSVASVKYYDSANVLQTLDTSIYDIDIYSDPGLVKLAYGKTWPMTYDRPNAVEIEFDCGYTTIPESIKSAIKLKCELLFGNVTDNDSKLLERAIFSLINPYRLMKFC